MLNSHIINTKRAERSAGFTLLEMMVVVMIIGLLAAMVVPNLISNKGKANQKKAVADIVALESALDMYHLDHNRYPTQEEGLKSLVTAYKNNEISGYIRRIPKDPWGSDYQYNNPGKHSRIDVYTYGQNGENFGNSPSTEIGNWNINEF